MSKEFQANFYLCLIMKGRTTLFPLVPKHWYHKPLFVVQPGYYLCYFLQLIIRLIVQQKRNWLMLELVQLGRYWRFKLGYW